MHFKIPRFLKEILIFILISTLVVFGYWISLQKIYFKDVTKFYALSQTTQSLLKQFDKKIQITLYTKDIDIHHQINMLIERYQLQQPHIHFHWERQTLNEHPFSSHTLLLQFQDQKQKIPLENGNLEEHQLTSALFKMFRKSNQWIVFLQGHQEPSPFDTANKDFQLFQKALENQGLKSQQLNITNTPFIPDNTQVLVIASPKSALMPIEEKLISNYIASGKDLLWLVDPDTYPTLFLSRTFGIFPAKGTIVDLYGQKLGTPHPAITIVNRYPNLPFGVPNAITAFPWAVALVNRNNPAWQTQAMLLSNELSWTETDEINGSIGFDPEKEELMGPLAIGYILNRAHSNHPQGQQRIAVIGNSKFLSNGAIQNYGNLALGLNLLNWLSHDDALIQISQPVVQDVLYHLHFYTALAIQYGFTLFPWLILVLASLYFYRRERISNRIAIRLAKI